MAEPCSIKAQAELLRQRDYKTLTKKEKVILHLAELCFMDDKFLSEVFRDDIEGVSYLLRVILGREDLTVLSAGTQVEYPNTRGRSVRLDIRAEDETGKLYDIEIQKATAGAGPQRARYYSAVIDRDMLDAGEKFDQLADSYVIFVTETDVMAGGMPLYHIDRRVEELNCRPFGDGSHIVYVNGAYRDPTHPIGRLMHDFHCTDAGEMYSDILANRMKNFKESEGGSKIMSTAWEQFLNEEREEGRAQCRAEGRVEGRAEGHAEGRTESLTEVARAMLGEGIFTYENIARLTKLPLDVIEQLAKESAEAR